MAGVKVTPRPPRAQPPGSAARRERFVADRLPPRSQRIDVVAVAASTGGPAALASIAGSLPPDLSVPVLVVQHIREGFEAALVDLLDRVSRLTVRLASSGDAPTPGEILVAPPHAHLGFSPSGRVVLDHSAPIDGHRPSANFLFGSLARSHGARAMGVVLTGMGRDGAEGLSQLHAAGGWALAQDRSTSVVYGMPGAAVDGGAVDRVVPLQQMGDAIAEAASWGRVPFG